MTGQLQTYLTRRLPPCVAGQNDIVLVDQYGTGKTELVDALDSNRLYLFSGTGSDVLWMRLDRPDLSELKFLRNALERLHVRLRSLPLTTCAGRRPLKAITEFDFGENAAPLSCRYFGLRPRTFRMPAMASVF